MSLFGGGLPLLGGVTLLLVGVPSLLGTPPSPVCCYLRYHQRQKNERGVARERW